MLHTLRQFSNHFVIKILMLMLVGSFLLWGINDVFRSGKIDKAFEVGDKSVTYREFQIAVKREQEYFRKRFGGQVTDAQLNAFGIERIVLERMIVENLLQQHTQDMGWDVGYASAVAAIRQYPAFKDEQGNFVKQYFDMYLSNQHMKERDYLNNLRNEIVINSMRDAMFSQPIYPAALAKPIFSRSIESRVYQKITVPASYIETIAEPDNAQLTTFFNDHHKEFAAPEYRLLSWVVLDSKTLADRFSVTDEDVKKKYEATKEQYSTSGSRDIDNLFFKTESEALKAYQRLQKGDAFEVVAKEEAKQDLSAFRLSHVSRPDLPGAISQPAFALLEGEYSKPIQSDLGWNIVRAAKVYAQSYTPLEKVAETIRQGLKSEKVAEGMYQITNQIEDALAGGGSLEEVAKQFNLEVKTAGPVDNHGFNLSGNKVAEMPSSAIFVKTAFESEKGVSSAILESEDNTQRFILRVNEVTKARTRSLDEVHAKVVDAWKNERKDVLLKEAAESIQAQLAKGADVQSLQGVSKLKVTTETLGRGDSHGSAVENIVFSLAQSGVSPVLANPNDGYDIVRLVRIDAMDVPEKDARYDEFRHSIGKLMQNELYEQYVNNLRKDYPVNVYVKLDNSDL